MTTTSDLWGKLNDPEYRKAFVASQINVSVPFQIRALMKAHGWTQEQLAEKTGMRQPSISGLITPGKTRPNIETLRRLAEAFDCGLAVRFVPFSELADWSEKFDPDTFSVPDFSHDSKSSSSVGVGSIWGYSPSHYAEGGWRGLALSNQMDAVFAPAFEYLSSVIAYTDAESPVYYDAVSSAGSLVREVSSLFTQESKVVPIDAKARLGSVPRKTVSSDRFSFGFMANKTDQQADIRTGT